MALAEKVAQVEMGGRIRPFPGHGDNVVGMFGRVGQALPVLSTFATAGDHVVLLGVGDRSFGVLVKEVLGIARLEESVVGAPPDGSARPLIAGVVRTNEGLELVISVAELDRELNGAAATAAAPDRPIASLADELPLRLLLVEDNIVVQTMMKRLLRKFGYTLDVAANGREAVVAMEKTPYDIVFMDLHLPEMDGLEAMSEIARRWPAKRPTVIAMSADDSEEDRQECLAAGMNDYLAKPVREADLGAMLKRWGSRPTTPSTTRRS